MGYTGIGKLIKFLGKTRVSLIPDYLEGDYL